MCGARKGELVCRQDAGHPGTHQCYYKDKLEEW